MRVYVSTDCDDYSRDFEIEVEDGAEFIERLELAALNIKLAMDV